MASLTCAFIAIVVSCVLVGQGEAAVSNNIAAFFSTTDGYWTNTRQAETDSTIGVIQSPIFAGLLPAFGEDPILVHRDVFNNKTILQLFGVVREDENNVIYITPYFQRNSDNRKLEDLTLEDFEPGQCESVVRLLGPTHYYEDLRVCPPGETPRVYTIDYNCTVAVVTVPEGAPGPVPSATYIFDRYGPSVPVPGAPEDFQDPCADQRDEY